MSHLSMHLPLKAQLSPGPLPVLYHRNPTQPPMEQTLENTRELDVTMVAAEDEEVRPRTGGFGRAQTRDGSSMAPDAGC